MLRVTAVMAVWVLCSFASLFAQDSPDPSPAPISAKRWVFNAELDSYSSFNYNHPSSGVNALRNFDNRSGSPRLNAAALTFEYKTDHFGIHVDGGYGDMFSTIAATDNWKGANQYIMQGYVSYRPKTDSALQFDFGKFYTSVCAEVPDALANFNYSRSFTFSLGTPYYHFGLRTAIPVTPELTVGVQLINGMNDVTGQNHGEMIGFTAALTKKKWGWNQVWITGTERVMNQPAYRNLADEVITFTPVASLEGYFEVLYGHESRTMQTSDRYYGAAAALRWHATKKLSFSPRLEYYGDPNGFTSGTAQNLREVTLTADYKVHPMITTRFEFRRDHSDQLYFQEGSNRLTKNQQTLLAALLFAWKKER